MLSYRRLLFTFLVILTMANLLGANPLCANPVFTDGAKGDPELRSIDVLSFASEGVLLVGDGRASQIVAIDTKDTTRSAGLAKSIDNIAGKMAARMGTTAKGIQIIDLAVNPASGKIYFAVLKQDGKDKSYAILTVDGGGQIGELELDNVSYARIKLASQRVKISRITDVAWAGGKIVAAGRGNETFSSKIFSVLAPVKHNQAGLIVSAETYHVSHRKWETKAPMSVLIPYKENGKSYVVGAFSCTPVVKYPIDAITDGGKVTGSSVLELGSGNRPIDMFIYEKNGKSYVLANTFRFHHKRKAFGPSPYWTVKFEQSVLAETQAVNTKALRRLGKNYTPATKRVEMVESYHGVTQMDQLDAKRAVVLRMTKTGLRLEPIALP